MGVKLQSPGNARGVADIVPMHPRMGVNLKRSIIKLSFAMMNKTSIEVILMRNIYLI
jgi:hypothetical protein